jgi:hypothetical protein
MQQKNGRKRFWPVTSAVMAFVILMFTHCDILSVSSDGEADAPGVGAESGASARTAIELTVDAAELTDGAIGGGEYRWYMFDAIADAGYYLYIDDGSTFASGTYTCPMRKPVVFRADLLAANALEIAGRGFYPDEPYELFAVASETLYIRLESGTSTSKGTFGIRVAQIPESGAF